MRRWISDKVPGIGQVNVKLPKQQRFHFQYFFRAQIFVLKPKPVRSADEAPRDHFVQALPQLHSPCPFTVAQLPCFRGAGCLHGILALLVPVCGVDGSKEGKGVRGPFDKNVVKEKRWKLKKKRVSMK
jgi:hypothetical protein